MMIKIYLTVSNVILNFIIFKIAILVNLIKKALKIDKDICIVTIYKCTDIVYLMVGNSKEFIILITVSAAIFELSSPV